MLQHMPAQGPGGEHRGAARRAGTCALPITEPYALNPTLSCTRLNWDPLEGGAEWRNAAGARAHHQQVAAVLQCGQQAHVAVE